jgi:hypothetical protein
MIIFKTCIVLGYVLFLFSGLFLGLEFEEVKHDEQMREANKKILNCQYVITKGSLYE